MRPSILTSSSPRRLTRKKRFESILWNLAWVHCLSGNGLDPGFSFTELRPSLRPLVRDQGVDGLIILQKCNRRELDPQKHFLKVSHSIVLFLFCNTFASGGRFRGLWESSQVDSGGSWLWKGFRRLISRFVSLSLPVSVRCISCCNVWNFPGVLVFCSCRE